MKKQEFIYIAVLALIIAFMDITGIPSVFFINVCVLPYCFSSINGYADLTLYIVVPVYIILGIYSFIELKKA